MLFRIHDIAPLGNVVSITLEAPEGFGFFAGQYLSIRHPDGGAIPMSIASAPSRLPWVVLHYRSLPGIDEARWMDELLGRRAPLAVEGPFGNVWLDDPPSEPLLIIAGGTGASQATSLIEHLDATGGAPTTLVLWSVSAPIDLYNDVYFERMARLEWLTYRAFIDDPRGANRLLPWLGNPEHLGAHVLRGEAVISGPPPFVHAVVPVLEAAGVPRPRMRADVFDYAPLPSTP